MAYVQLAETIFRTGLTIDVVNVGRVIIPEVKKEKRGDKDVQVFAGYNEKKQIGDVERQKRVVAVMEAVGRLSDFAKQARSAVSLSPDIVMISLLPVYSQRGLRCLSLNDKGNINIDELGAIVADLQGMGGEVVFGYTPGVIANDPAFRDWMTDKKLDHPNPIAAIQKAVDRYRGL